MMSDNSDLVKNPWAMLAMTFPGLRRLLTFIKPTLGLNVDGATVALKQFQAVQQVRFFRFFFGSLVDVSKLSFDLFSIH